MQAEPGGPKPWGRARVEVEQEEEQGEKPPEEAESQPGIKKPPKFNDKNCL